MVDAVMQPTVHEQVLSSAISFVEVAVVNRKDVAIFQIRESAILAPVQLLCPPNLRDCVPEEGITVIPLALPRLIPPKEIRGVIVRKHRHDGDKFA